MCTRQEVKEEVIKALTDNNSQRNTNLDNKLHKLKMEIFDNTSDLISRIKTTPETRAILDQMRENCTKTTTEYNIITTKMQDDLKHIRQYMVEDKVWKKDFSKEMTLRLEEKADQKELDEMKTVIEKLKQFRWQTLAILGVAWALFEKFF